MRRSNERLRRWLCSLLLLFLAAGILAPAARAANAPRKVRVGYYTMSNFQEYDEQTQTYRGYSYDYMLALAQYANWTYEFVPVSYSDGLQMLKDGQLDLMNNVEMGDSATPYLAYSTLPSGTSCTCLAVSRDNTDVAYEDFSAIEKLTVGLDYASALNSGFVDYCKDNDCMPTLIYYHTSAGVAAGMQSGEIGAYIVSDLQDTAMRAVAKFDTRAYYLATTRGNSDLLRELNIAMNALKTDDPYFEEKIYAKYHAKSSEEQTVISSDEKAFVADSGPIRVAYDPAWYPISYTGENGRFSGAMASVFDFISERTGLQFEYVKAGSAEEALESLRSGQAQVYAGFPYDYTWAQRYAARITSPFATLTVFAAYKSGDMDGDVYAVPAGGYLHYLSETVRQDGYAYKEYNSVQDCLSSVLTGGADFAFLDSYQVEYYRERASYRELAFKVTNGEDYGLCVAVSDGADERLYTIIDKALASASSEEIGNILRETSNEAGSRTFFDVLYANPRTAGIFFAILGFLIAVVISALIYTQTMRRKNEELKTATSAKSEFLSNMSHDMRTPLNGIIGYTDLALKTDEPARRTDYLRKIKISGQFLLSLINDTLDISKIESGKLTLKPEPVDLQELLDSIVVPIRQTAGEKGVGFTVDTDGMRGGTILADRLNLQKIILNLLSNAVKFTPKGGNVTLCIASTPPDRDGINTRITVTDTGIGIGREFLSRMFEPFAQERAAGGEEAPGSGLGLSIVKSIVDLMGGRVEASSSKGTGSRFDVLLPIRYTESAGAAPAKKTADEGALRGLKILLCEDNEMNREIARSVLEGFGVQVRCASDGREGLEIFAASPVGGFDAVLMDLRMPRMNGFEATRSIRSLARPDAAQVPIVAMSADAYEDDLQRCADAGMSGHIPKPFDPAELRETLARMCGASGGEPHAE
ncbi:MAG: transporter substrate-binding domain-containing protein [Oscillospiraceae bacterium]|nr:transporter substrate-binding domain-containing protein [Oscillospiraceae bacterium]